MKRPVLLVEDDRQVADLLQGWLKKLGYGVVCAGNGREALGRMDRGAFDLVVSDLAMPRMDGMALVRALSARAGDPPVIILSGQGTIQSAVQAMKYGAVDFLEKPVNFGRFHAAVSAAIQALDERRALLGTLKTFPAEPLEVQALLGSIRGRQDRELVLEALASALDVRESETGRHSLRVSKLSCVLGERFGLTSAELDRLRRGAILHDIGKIGLPDSVLLKPGPLSGDEWNEMKRHPEIGARMVEPFGFLDSTVEIIMSHHERWDGAGYPGGLKGSDIPLLARLFTVIDSYDAMLSPRAYRPGLSEEAAFEEVRRGAGTQFDPDVVRVFGSTPARQWGDLHRSVEV